MDRSSQTEASMREVKQKRVEPLLRLEQRVPVCTCDGEAKEATMTMVIVRHSINVFYPSFI